MTIQQQTIWDHLTKQDMSDIETDEEKDGGNGQKTMRHRRPTWRTIIENELIDRMNSLTKFKYVVV